MHAEQRQFAFVCHGFSETLWHRLPYVHRPMAQTAQFASCISAKPYGTDCPMFMYGTDCHMFSETRYMSTTCRMFRSGLRSSDSSCRRRFSLSHERWCTSLMLEMSRQNSLFAMFHFPAVASHAPSITHAIRCFGSRFCFNIVIAHAAENFQ